MYLTKDEKKYFAEENYSLVFYVMKTFENLGVPYDEMQSIAFKGYIKALNTFNKEKNTKLLTYVINYIRNEIVTVLNTKKAYKNRKKSISPKVKNTRKVDSGEQNVTVDIFPLLY